MNLNIYHDIKKSIQPFDTGALLRLGNNYDGGYVLSQKLLSHSKSLFSLGSNNEWSFELDFVKKASNYVLIIDDNYSQTILIKTLIYRVLSIFNFRQFRFKISEVMSLFSICFGYITLKIKSKNKVRYLNHSVGTNNKAHSISFGQLWNLFFSNKADMNVLVKMDIEGSEYACIEDILKVHDQLSGIIIEFHDILEKPDRFFQILKEIQSVFTIEHVHYNNYSKLEYGLADVIEITFINNDLCNEKMIKLNREYPLLGLDYPNNLEKEDFKVDLNSN
ncbi:MAG: hypothetical protein ACI80H_000306 [Pseudoalteromonas distincta]|jgi:hypothetical protein